MSNIKTIKGKQKIVEKIKKIREPISQHRNEHITNTYGTITLTNFE